MRHENTSDRNEKGVTGDAFIKSHKPAENSKKYQSQNQNWVAHITTMSEVNYYLNNYTNSKRQVTVYSIQRVIEQWAYKCNHLNMIGNVKTSKNTNPIVSCMCVCACCDKWHWVNNEEFLLRHEALSMSSRSMSVTSQTKSKFTCY